MPRRFLIASSLTALALTTACADDQSSKSFDQAEIEDIIRSYLVENPEVIEEALIELQARRDAKQASQSKAAILNNAERLKNDNRDYSIGPADAAVTIVEFFDYRCGPCRASMPWVTTLPARYEGNVRVVFKELPILSPESRIASLMALAAGRQGKYNEMHQALMQNRSKFSNGDLNAQAEKLGLDLEQLRADMALPEFEQHLNENYALAQLIGANATPSFVVGDDLSAGLDRVRLEGLISQGIADAG